MGILDIITGKVSKDRFATLYMRGLKQRGETELRYDAAQFCVHVGNQQHNLDNAWFDYQQAPRRRRKEVLGNYLDAQLETIDETGSLERLMPVLRNRAQMWFTREQALENGSKVAQEITSTQSLLLGHDHSVHLVMDSPRTVRFVWGSELKRLGVSFEEALDIAINNLRDRMPEKWTQLGAHSYAGNWNDSFDCSRLLLTDQIYRLNLPGRPVALIPARGVLLVASDHYPDEVLAITQIALNLLEHNNRWTSSEFLVLDNKNWSAWEPQDAKLQTLHNQLRTQMRATDYKNQKDILERKLGNAQPAIFVTNYQVYRNTDTDRLFSVATWAEAGEAWLPKTQKIAFVREPTHGQDEEKPVFVAWERAAPLVAPLMEAVPDVYPERYHVKAFPSADVLERLEELAEQD